MCGSFDIMQGRLELAKKILILNGSPRLKGNTAMLCDAFMDGVISAGHEVSRHDLQRMDIKGCMGCMKGGKNEASPCVIKDDMDKIYPDYRAADLVVLASPMYYWSISGQLKCAFDRLFAVAECNADYANPVKDCALIMAAEGNTPDNWKPALDYYEALIHFMKWRSLGRVLAGGVLDAGAVAGTQAIEEARRFGAALYSGN